MSNERLGRLAECFALTPRVLRLVWSSSRLGSLALGVLTLAAAGLPLAIAWVGKAIMDAIVAGASRATVRWVLLELGMVAAQAFAQRGLILARSLLGAKLGVDVSVMILQKALTLDLCQLEDAAFYDKLTRARHEASSRPSSVVIATFELLQNTLLLAGYAVLLARESGLAMVGIVVAAIPATLVEMKYSNSAFCLRYGHSSSTRRMGYLEHVLGDHSHAKEVKLLGLGPLLLDRYRRLGEAFNREDRRLSVRRAVVTYTLSLLGTGAYYAAYVSIALAAAVQRISLGDMMLYAVVLRQGQQAFQAILTAVGGMYEDNLYMSNLFQFLGIPAGAPALPAAAPAVDAEHGIRFERVGFRYPGKADWALRDLSLFVPRGQSLALVGHNGAGKTTLIKLLTRLYEPTEGRILLDGLDLCAWEPEVLRRRIGVVFQDFGRYELTLRDNVGLGSVPHLADEAQLRRAMARGGVAEGMAGLDTQLGRWFEGSVDLSGGEWQKVALARGFMREEADLLVLDEPTAALDAEAEHAVFERFRQLAAGKTAILISHRFPTVRMADHIVVLEQGRVLEEGTHQELVARGGRYAQLFALQARGYQ